MITDHFVTSIGFDKTPLAGRTLAEEGVRHLSFDVVAQIQFDDGMLLLLAGERHVTHLTTLTTRGFPAVGILTLKEVISLAGYLAVLTKWTRFQTYLQKSLIQSQTS